MSTYRQRIPKFRGFANKGNNSCFINSIVQLLCHSQGFKRIMSFFRCPLLGFKQCIPCELAKILSQHDRNFISMNAMKLQNLLCDIFPHKGFQTNQKGDAMEALNVILQAIHSVYMGDSSQGLVEEVLEQSCDQNCPSHSVFSLVLVENLLCDCQNSKDTHWDTSNFLQTFYVESLLEINNQQSYRLVNIQFQDLTSNFKFSSILPLVGEFPVHFLKNFSQDWIEECAGDDQNCKYKKSRRKIYLKNQPLALVFNIVWRQIMPRSFDMLKLLASLPDKISLDALYANSAPVQYHLKALVMFGCGHYNSYILSYQDFVWRKFDDENVREFSNKFGMIHDMIKGKMHPVGVMYDTYKGFKQPQKLTKKSWIYLEKIALLSDQYYQEQRIVTQQLLMGLSGYQESKKQESVQENIQQESPEVNQTEEPKQVQSSVEIPKFTQTIKVQQPQELPSWVCKCSQKNALTNLICVACQSLKPGEEGWLCSHCKFLNEPQRISCQLCMKRSHKLEEMLIQSSERKSTNPHSRHSFRSPIATKPRTTTPAISHLNTRPYSPKITPNPAKTISNFPVKTRPKTSVQRPEFLTSEIWVCLCGQKNKSSKCSFCSRTRNSALTCFLCKSEFSGLKYCNLCGNSFSIFCRDCDQSPKNAICENCLSMVWKCRYCNRLNRNEKSYCFRCRNSKPKRQPHIN